MAQKVLKSQTLEVHDDGCTNLTESTVSFIVGSIIDRGILLIPGEDYDSIVYETVDVDGNILDKQEATLCIRTERSPKKPKGN